MNGIIEKLTDEERDYLAQGGATQKRCTLAYKALRIIDQLTAALGAAEKRAEYNAEGIEFWSMRYTAANDQAEALQVRVAELEAECEYHGVVALRDRCSAAEAELAAAKARVAELEAENERLLGDYYGGRTYDYEASERRAVAAESELADLRGRVEALVPDGCLSVFASAIREALRGR